MRRFFVPPENISGNQVVVTGSEVSHIRTVLRLKVGDNVLVVDGKGCQHRVELEQVERKEIRGCIISTEPIHTESPIDIRLGQVLIKGNKFDAILRKAIELGASRVVPVISERSLVRFERKDEAKRISRWQKIALEASSQCGRAQVATVEAMAYSVGDFCAASREDDLKLIFWEEEDHRALKDIRLASPPPSISCLTGPEGGFSASEVDLARDHGFQTVSLGRRILRADTAPVVVLSLLQYLWGDL